MAESTVNPQHGACSLISTCRPATSAKLRSMAPNIFRSRLASAFTPALFARARHSGMPILRATPKPRTESGRSGRARWKTSELPRNTNPRCAALGEAVTLAVPRASRNWTRLESVDACRSCCGQESRALVLLLDASRRHTCCLVSSYIHIEKTSRHIERQRFLEDGPPRFAKLDANAIHQRFPPQRRRVSFISRIIFLNLFFCHFLH